MSVKRGLKLLHSSFGKLFPARIFHPPSIELDTMKFIHLLLLLGTLSLPVSVYAKLVQIIHTNDLHSFFAGSRSGLGGYSRIKTLIDQLKSDATTKGIPSLYLDGGDFGEGSSYYFSNNGVDALKALDLLGVDVTVLGNHDFILGGKQLRDQLNASGLKAHLLSANLKGKALMGLKKKIKNYVDYDIDGNTIRIFGLTTPEIHYQYPLLPNGFISGSHKKGIKMARQARKDGVDFVIALTHLGLDKDSILVSHSRSIDMVIGGHSHTRLGQPKMVENLKGEIIPIFQTGAHGMAVGSLIVDILGDGEYKLIDYRLYDVTQDIPEDQAVKKFVDEAYINRERYFNRSWSEVIGFSEITLTGLYKGKVRNPRSCWSRHIARLTRTTAETDLSLQFDVFQGEEIPAGPIRFGDLIDNFPHFRAWGDKGWTISRATISGLVLNQILKGLSGGDQPFDATLDGVEAFDEAKGMLVPYEVGGAHQPHQARIKGEEINNLKFYTIALPSEIPFAIGKFSNLIQDLLLIRSQEVPNSDYWSLMENYLRQNSPLKCLKD